MLYVVIGPPAAGKSTWCNEQAQDGDIIVDYDKLATALSAPTSETSTHSHPGPIKTVIRAARQAAIDTAIGLADQCNVYVIHSTPNDALLTRYRNLGADIITIDPGEATVRARVKAERPWQMNSAVKRWYEGRPGTHQAHAPRPDDTTLAIGAALTTTAKGLGYDHQKVRDQLLAHHHDGTPCWWCARPMYRDPTANWDKLPLAADHTQARKYGGTKADRLLHFKCNSARGKGDRDHLRPAAAEARGNRMAW